MVEGKLKICIKEGKFSFDNDLYIKVLCDGREVGKTDDSDSSTPSWDWYVSTSHESVSSHSAIGTCDLLSNSFEWMYRSSIVKHIKGDYDKLIFQLLDEDTCTWLYSSHLNSASRRMNWLNNCSFSRWFVGNLWKYVLARHIKPLIGMLLQKNITDFVFVNSCVFVVR